MNSIKVFFCFAAVLFISCATEIVSEEICINGVCASSEDNPSVLFAECPYYNNSTHFCDSRDYKIYKYTAIGEQIWMAENLNYAAIGSKCYNNRDRYCDVYGRLYNWAAANIVCPSGWRLPSAAEQEALSGLDLKEAGGFAALPGGIGYSDGSFISVGYYGHWWSASEINAEHAYLQSFIYHGGSAFLESRNKANLYSVRCVQE